MRPIRFVAELILLVVAVFFLFLGLNWQAGLGIGLILGSVVIAVFILELFFYQRSQEDEVFKQARLETFLAGYLGFNWKDEKLLDANNLTTDDVGYIKKWYEGHAHEEETRTKFWTKEFLDRLIPLGIDWASGYTPNLDKFSGEQTHALMSFDDHVVLQGYKREIELVERILAQDGRNNVCLVGQEGMGQQFILAGLEGLVESGQALPALAYKRVIWLDVDAVLAGIHDAGELRSRLELIFSEALYAGNIVLFIERIHALFDPALPELPDIMIPFLQSARSQVVATTSPEFFAAHLSRPDLASQLARVSLQEPSPEYLLIALQEVADHIQKTEKVSISYPVIKKVMELTDRFSLDIAHPEKDIDLLGEVVSFVKSKGANQVQVVDVVQVISQRSGIPLGTLREDEAQKLLHLDEYLRQHLIGQEAAVRVITDALKRARTEIQSTKRPIGSFLFLGPTGVGKTTAAKALAGLYFGDEKRMVRFDMSEYQELADVKHLAEGLASQIKQHPYSLLLLDELEKAHSKVLNLFLQVLDEGIFTDELGLKVDFRNVIIIATSNAGSEFIRSHIEEVQTEHFNTTLLNEVQSKGIFSPEFLNRFDALVVFKPLGPDELSQIAKLLLTDTAAQLKQQHHITLTQTAELISFLVAKGYDPEYGARPMRRVLQDSIETLIADKLLKGQVKPGDTLTLDINEVQAFSRS